MGVPFMPWQQAAADVAGEYYLDDLGHVIPYYRKVIITVPRQSGKTTLLVPLVLYRCLAWPWRRPQRVVYTAQTGIDAKTKWLEHVEMIEHSPLASLMSVSKANGAEAMHFPQTRSRWGIKAPTKAGGHGQTLDLGLLDEAFSQVDYRVEQAMRPAMLTRVDAQMIVISTMGDDTSVYLNDQVDLGRAAVDRGDDSGICYIEYSAHPDDDPYDPQTWAGCMPALGFTQTVATIAEEARSTPIGEFTRALLNLRTATVETVIPLALWNACRYEGQTPGPGRQLHIALDVSHERDDAAIVLASARPDGRTHVEVIATYAGPRPLVGAVKELSQRYRPASIWVDPLGPAGSLIPELQRELWDPSILREATTADVVRSCGAIYDLVTSGTLAHLDDPLLNAAVAGAGSRPLGDAWAWRRKSSSVSITTLIAASLAVWGTRAEYGGAGIS